MNRMPDALVLGGSSLVADYLLPRMGNRFGTVTVVARRALRVPDGVQYAGFASLVAGDWTPPAEATLLSLLPLPALIDLLPRLTSARTIVALGSTRRFSHAQSPDAGERIMAEALATAEGDLARWCGDHRVRYTILRPTLIYDMKRDLNLARMAGFIRRFRVLPLARPATGLRQPIHADDVAKAMLGALDNPGASDRMFNIAGGERITYRTMAERVFTSQKLKPRFLLLPTGLLRLGFQVAGRLGLVKNPSFVSSVFQRMNEDQIFDLDEGRAVLGYDPRRFDPA